MYLVIKADDTYSLTKEVNEKLKEGYKVVGGITTGYFKQHPKYLQAMIKLEINEIWEPPSEN